MKRLMLVFGVLAMMVLSAIGMTGRAYADNINSDVCSGSGAASTFCHSQTTDNPVVGPKGILTKVVQIIIMITAIAAVIMIIVGGFQYIISSGDANNVNNAKNTILYAVVGLVVALVGQAIVSLVLQKL